jgi:hypothetical protein
MKLRNVINYQQLGIDKDQRGDQKQQLGGACSAIR